MKGHGLAASNSAKKKLASSTPTRRSYSRSHAIRFSDNSRPHRDQFHFSRNHERDSGFRNGAALKLRTALSMTSSARKERKKWKLFHTLEKKKGTKKKIPEQIVWREKLRSLKNHHHVRYRGAPHASASHLNR